MSEFWGKAQFTLPLLPGRSAQDAGDDMTCPLTDAQGELRPFGVHCDIGAYEAQFVTRRYILPLAYRQ